jgi:hypothetical protein
MSRPNARLEIMKLCNFAYLMLPRTAQEEQGKQEGEKTIGGASEPSAKRKRIDKL